MGNRAQVKLPISAIVVGLDEGYLLRNCLASLNFCSELIYVDLGSHDDSVLIAQELATTVTHHDLVPIGEYVVAKLVNDLKHDWVLFLDPDEVLDSILQNDIAKLFEQDKISDTIGVISAPEVYYFKNRLLNGTPWGGVRGRLLIAHRRRFKFSAEVHRGRELNTGFEQLPLQTEGIIHHYWSSSWKSLFRKHRRYLKLEGRSLYSTGQRISLGGVVVALPNRLVSTFRESWKISDGMRGFLLCLFWVWYKSAAQFSLWSYQRELVSHSEREQGEKQ